MNTKVYKSLAAFALLAMVVQPIFAQSAGALKITIPFNFTIGKTQLPSGDYTIQSLSGAEVRVQSDGNDNRPSVIFLTVPAGSKGTSETGKLVFNRYGDQYFLSEIWQPVNSRERALGRALIKSRAEIELAKKMSRPEATVLAAKK